MKMEVVHQDFLKFSVIKFNSSRVVRLGVADDVAVPHKDRRPTHPVVARLFALVVSVRCSTLVSLCFTLAC